MLNLRKVLLIASIILLIVLLIEVFLYLKTQRGLNFEALKALLPSNQQVVDTSSLPLWNPIQDTNKYDKYYFEGPTFIGERSGEKKILYYKGIIENYDKQKQVLKLSLTGHELSLKLPNNFLIISSEDKTTKFVDSGFLKAGKLVTITQGADNQIIIHVIPVTNEKQ